MKGIDGETLLQLTPSDFKDLGIDSPQFYLDQISEFCMVTNAFSPVFNFSIDRDNKSGIDISAWLDEVGIYSRKDELIKGSYNVWKKKNTDQSFLIVLNTNVLFNLTEDFLAQNHIKGALQKRLLNEVFQLKMQLAKYMHNSQFSRSTSNPC